MQSKKKGVKGGDKFIEQSPSGIVQSPVPLSRQGRSDRTKKSHSVKSTQGKMLIGLEIAPQTHLVVPTYHWCGP